jgi:hypothetical protein
VDGYECIADPGPDWVPTKKDERRQREREELKLHARRIAADAPPLSQATLERVAVLMSRPTALTELMEWRLRLFCGHVVARTAHHTHTTVHGAFMGAIPCSECRLDPATIVAVEAIGRVAMPTPPSKRPGRDAAAIRSSIAQYERQIEDLRRQLGD